MFKLIIPTDVDTDSNGISSLLTEYTSTCDPVGYGGMPVACPSVFKPYTGDNSSLSDCEYLKPTHCPGFPSTSSSLASTPGGNDGFNSSTKEQDRLNDAVANYAGDSTSTTTAEDNATAIDVDPTAKQAQRRSCSGDANSTDTANLRGIDVGNDEPRIACGGMANEPVRDAGKPPLEADKPSLQMNNANDTGDSKATFTPVKSDSRPDIACADDASGNAIPVATTPDEILPRPDLMSASSHHSSTTPATSTPDLTSGTVPVPSSAATVATFEAVCPDLTSTPQPLCLNAAADIASPSSNAAASPDVTTATARPYSQSSCAVRPDVTSPCKSQRSFTSPDVTMSDYNNPVPVIASSRSPDVARSTSRPDITSTLQQSSSSAAVAVVATPTSLPDVNQSLPVVQANHDDLLSASAPQPSIAQDTARGTSTTTSSVETSSPSSVVDDNVVPLGSSQAPDLLSTAGDAISNSTDAISDNPGEFKSICEI